MPRALIIGCGSPLRGDDIVRGSLAILLRRVVQLGHGGEGPKARAEVAAGEFHRKTRVEVQKGYS
jgi:hypothetical protein